MSQVAPPMVSHLDKAHSGVEIARQARISVHPHVSLEMRLWIGVLLLLAVGFVMIYSASSAIALRKFADANYYLKRQALFASAGIVVLLITSRIPYRIYEDLVYWLLLGAITALALVLVPGIGTEINHARRWFKLGFILVQPAEFAKLFWIVYLSVSLARKRDKIRRFSIGFVPHMVLLGLLGYLLLREPDFGSCVLLTVLTFLMLAVAGVRWRYLFALVPLAAIAFYQLVYRVPYRLERITAFLNPWTDPLDSGYHLIQAWIAVGSGGLWGKGLGVGQQKLFYLPEPYTDFIFAVVGEELGFSGVVIVVLLFFSLFWTGLRVARQAPDLLGSHLALALTSMLSLQALINMSVVLGLVPTKGLPLPFVSYGGSALMANCLAVGIIMSIARSGARSE
jgi:cell division protein FtsW